MAQLADFVGSAAAGTQAGKLAAPENPLGGFVRNMLSVHKMRMEEESKGGLLLLQSIFNTQGDIAKEKREQASPKYVAETAAADALAKERNQTITGELTPAKAIEIISKMDYASVMAMKRNAPEQWTRLTSIALNGAEPNSTKPEQPQQPDMNDPNAVKLYLINRYFPERMK